MVTCVMEAEEESNLGKTEPANLADFSLYIKIRVCCSYYIHFELDTHYPDSLTISACKCQELSWHISEGHTT